jgi:hypothetical protein
MPRDPHSLIWSRNDVAGNISKEAFIQFDRPPILHQLLTCYTKANRPFPLLSSVIYQVVQVESSSHDILSDSIFRRRPGGTSVVRCY